MMKAVRDYLLSCEVIDEFAKVGVDFLGNDPEEFTLESVPVDPIIKRYTDGGSLRQFVFVFASRNYYGPDVWQNLENLGFYEKLSAWFEAKTHAGDLPVLGTKKYCQTIEALTSGYIFDATEDQARYQLQARITYLQL